MVQEKMKAARTMAEEHAAIDPDVRAIYLLESAEDQEDDTAEPIKLLEVVEGTLEAGIEPIKFAARPERGVPYPTIIVDISPREFAAIPSIQERAQVEFDGEVWRLTEQLL